MQLRSPNLRALNLRSCLVLWTCSMAIGCEPDEPLDEAGTMIVGAGSDAGTSAPTSDAAGPTMMAEDAGVVAPGNSDDGNSDARDASGGTSDLDASASPSSPEAGGSTGGVVIGPSMRRDGGPPRWDPDAQGPVLNPAGQAACLMLADNICNRSADCQLMLGGSSAAQRTRLVDSCRRAYLRSHNCNRAIRAASGLTACAESTKTYDCQEVFATEFADSCLDQITFEP